MGAVVKALMNFLPQADILYVAAFLALGGALVYEVHHLKSEGAAAELKVVQAASAKAQAAAQKTIDALNAQHATAVATIEANYATALKTANAQHDSDLVRLREYEARNHGAGKVLGSTVPTGAPATSGADGVGPVGGAALSLASALRADDAALTACYAERDSLTGK